MALAVAYPHIEIENGVPVIAGTGTDVIHIALDRIAHHWDADEIQRQRPHLTLGQIYSALAYYHDHQDEIEREIERRMRVEQEFFDKFGTSPIQLKLRQIKIDRLRR